MRVITALLLSAPLGARALRRHDNAGGEPQGRPPVDFHRPASFSPDRPLDLHPPGASQVRPSRVPIMPALPGDEELERDGRVIRDIGTSHHDPVAPPKDWKSTDESDHWRTPMEEAGSENPDEWPAELGVLSEKALFIDDYVVNESSGLVRQLERGDKMGVVLQQSGVPEIAPSPAGFSFYGNVVHNGSHFLMFHQREGGVARALSQDGVTWKEDQMLQGIFDAEPMQPKAAFGGEMCIQHDPDAASKEQAWFAGVKCKGNELCVLTSADGLKWRYLERKWGRATDTYPCIYKEGRNYSAILRRDYGQRGGWREIRGVQVLEGQSDRIDKVEFNHKLSWYLDLYGKDEWRRRSVYAFSRTKYSNLYLGLAQVYEFPYGESERPFSTDVMQPYLVTSRDGKRFDLSWIRRTPLIPRGRPFDFDHGVIITAADWVTHGGYHWLYYGGWNAQHEKKHDQEAKIGLARWQQDRIVKLAPRRVRAGNGRVLTKALKAPPRANGLRLDANCLEQGSVGVKVLDARDPAKQIASGSAGDFDEPDRDVRLQFERGYSWRYMVDTLVQLEFTLSGPVSLYGFRFHI